MLDRIIYPERQLSQVYDITFLDDNGQEMPKPRGFRSLSDDIEREVQFRESAERMGASAYQVHLMTPQEVRATIREEEGSPLDQYLRFVSKVTGLDKMIGLLPAMAELEQPEHQPSAHFART